MDKLPRLKNTRAASSGRPCSRSFALNRALLSLLLGASASALLPIPSTAALVAGQTPIGQFQVVSDKQNNTPNSPESDPNQAIYQIGDEGFVLGISDRGGGYINKLTIPGKGNVMGLNSNRYGRGGQSAIRDYVHGLKYNPTQAGFTDDAGTWCLIDDNGNKKLTVLERPASLYRGDGVYDFTQNENLASDGYTGDGGNTDTDGVAEGPGSPAAGDQTNEVTSEWNYWGEYEYYKNKVVTRDNGTTYTVPIPSFRHQYKYIYRRFPGQAISQHIVDGDPNAPYDGKVNVDFTVTDITNGGVNAPTNKPVGGNFRNDMGVLKESWATRIDTDLWPEAIYRWSMNEAGVLTRQNRTLPPPNNTWYKDVLVKKNSTLLGRVSEPDGQVDQSKFLPEDPTERLGLIIIGDSADLNSGQSIGIFLPNNKMNRTIVGYNPTTGTELYRDDRRMSVALSDNYRRVEDPNDPTKSLMQLIGVEVNLTGILSPARIGIAGAREYLGRDVFILYGTPQQILDAAKGIDGI